MTTRSYEQPFAGLKVLDLSQGVAGPNCGMILALYGADVIKVEPEEGDWARGLGRRHGGHTTLEISGNRGKRSIALDLKAAAGREAALRLARNADIVLESFRPGVAARLGLGYEDIRRDNPRVLYVSISGFGQSGPYAGRPGTDLVLQAFSGLIGNNVGSDGVPHRIGFIVVDMVSSLYAFQAVSAALFGRERQSEGRHIDVNLMQSAAAIQSQRIVEYALEGGSAQALNVPTASYQTSDGWIAVVVVKEPQFAKLCAALERPDLAADPRFKDFATRARHGALLIGSLRDLFRGKPTAHWIELLSAADILCNRINSYGDWLADHHVQAIGAAPVVELPNVGPVTLPPIPGMPPLAPDDPRQLPPALGQHGREVLREIGYGDAEIDQLVQDRVLYGIG